MNKICKMLKVDNNV